MYRWTACLLALWMLCLTPCAQAEEATAATLPPLTQTAAPGDTAPPDSAAVEATAGAETETTAHPAATPVDSEIRVWLQSLGTRSALGMSFDCPYTLSGDIQLQLSPGAEIQLGLSEGGIALRVGGAVLSLGNEILLIRHADAAGEATGAYIHESEKDTLYCGDISISVYEGSLRVIVSLTVEDYLLGVLPYEMSDTFPIEALKAQAVAARTYAMQRRARNPERAYHVSDTANDQVYKGLDTRFVPTAQAVSETRGIVGLYNGAYAETFFSASNGGQTALATDVWSDTGDFGYLDIRDDPYDLENPESLKRTYAVPTAAHEMSSLLYGLLSQRAGELLWDAGVIGAGEGAGVAQVTNVEAVHPIYGGESRQYGTISFELIASYQKLEADEAGTMKLGETQLQEEPLLIEIPYYEELRDLLGLGLNSNRSDMISVEKTDTGFLLTTRRFGHGVGLSQRGAQWMAKAHDMDYLEILAFYYPGLDLAQLTWDDDVPTAAPETPQTLDEANPRPTPAPTPMPLPALAEGEAYGTVSVEGVDATVRVRGEPSAEASQIGVLRSGSRLIIESETEDGWAKIKTMEIEGYMMMAFIVKEDV